MKMRKQKTIKLLKKIIENIELDMVKTIKTIKITKEFRVSVQEAIDAYFCEHLDTPWWLDTWVDKMIDIIFEVRE